jgi:peptidoglycan/LPS O-acetylase OafA/YrhL
MSHIPALDGLRAVAIAMVVAFHYGLLDCGWLGVQLFFVLSGFLITRILQAAREQPLGHYLGRFWRRRALRIFPLYFGYLLLLSAVFVATGAPVAFADSALYLFTYTFNLTRPWLQQGSPAFTHFWSLCVEEQFYLLWPLAVFFLAPRRLPQLAIAMIAVAPVARLVLATSGCARSACRSMSATRSTGRRSVRWMRSRPARSSRFFGSPNASGIRTGSSPRRSRWRSVSVSRAACCIEPRESSCRSRVSAIRWRRSI